ncbi:MAG TPA: hypothetical protein PLR44_02450 [Thermomicrobiales bacterium]|jgi:hypothetical protein|nr:hypothetical protein [Thermomicrobiales bacterium]
MLSSVALAASSVTWEGINWGALSGTDINEIAGNLVVTNSGDWPAAHYNTSDSFRNTSTPSLTFTVIDAGPGTVTGGAYVEYEPYPWAGLFCTAAPGYDNYVINWWNEDDDVVIDTGIRRSAGAHTFEIGRRADGTVDCWIDGRIAASVPAFGMQSITDVYLIAWGGEPGDTVTYTAYAEGESYRVPTTKDECKKGGWQTFSDPSFANQGACVSFVAKSGR